MSGYDDDNVPTYTHLRPVDNKRTVEQVGGLQAVQPIRDGLVDTSFKQRNVNVPSDLLDIHNGIGGRGMVSETLRKMDEIGDLTIDDFMDAKVPLDEKKAFVKSMQRYGYKTNKSSVQHDDDPFSDKVVNFNDAGGRFVVEKATASLKSGAKIPVWMITDSNNGQQYQKAFKIHEAAHTVAELLNEYGKVTHPAVKKAITAYDTYNEILKRINTVKKAITEGGEVERKPQLTTLREQLEACGKAIGL